MYSYTDPEWGDLLTAYDGKPITYDGIGNILTYDGWTFNWEHGRELASMSNGTTTWTYTYDANGMRTSRASRLGTYRYYYDGGMLTRMEFSSYMLQFDSVEDTVTMNGTLYYYVRNLQGDVVAITDMYGDPVVYYTYDAWGNVLSITGSKATTLGALNPLRYRGYVYDQDTGLYYLQSRYYNPEWGRFINADAFVSTGQGFVGNNMYAYCLNNPVLLCDPSGAVARISNQFHLAQDDGCGGGSSDYRVTIKKGQFDEGIGEKLLQTAAAVLNHIVIDVGIGLGLYGSATCYDLIDIDLGIYYDVFRIHYIEGNIEIREYGAMGVSATILGMGLDEVESQYRMYGNSEWITDDSAPLWDLWGAGGYFFGGGSINVGFAIIPFLEEFGRIWR